MNRFWSGVFKGAAGNNEGNAQDNTDILFVVVLAVVGGCWLAGGCW